MANGSRLAPGPSLFGPGLASAEASSPELERRAALIEALRARLQGLKPRKGDTTLANIAFLPANLGLLAARGTGLGLLNLMQFGREGGTLTPSDILSVPLAGGAAGLSAGPRGMALAAGGKPMNEAALASLRRMKEEFSAPAPVPARPVQPPKPANTRQTTVEPAPESFVNEVMKVARSVKTPLFGSKTGKQTGTFSDKAAISDVFDAFTTKHPNIKITLDQFKELLTRAQRNRQLNLGRADLPQLLSRNTRERSFTRLGRDNVEFINLFE